MKKVADELEELREVIEEQRKEVEILKNKAENKASYWEGVTDAVKKFFWVCGFAWTTLAFAVNTWGEASYHKFPFIRRVVDAINGGTQ